MGVSQPLSLDNKLMEALRDAQRILDEHTLKGKITLATEVAGGSSTSAVESSMDRTAKDAKDAAEKSVLGGEGTGGAIGSSDKLVDVMQKLIKAIEVNASGGGGGRGRKRQAAPGEPPPDAEDGPGSHGYVNPYILQGLIQNPLGTTQNSIMGMLMGGAGAGLKAPPGLMKLLAGTGGHFQPGAALAAETGWASSGAAGTFANGALIGASKVAVPIAAFAGTMAWQNSAAKDRLTDAGDYMNDRAFGNNTGMNWRAGAWEDQFQSRLGIWQKDARDVLSSSGLGVGNLSKNLGNRGVVDLLDKAAATARGVGISADQMGGLIGAGARGGTFSLQGPDGAGQLTHYLALIENWTSKTAQFGFTSNESLQKLAEVGQKGMMGTNTLTMSAQTSLLSMDARARAGLPPELQRGGADSALGHLASDPNGETQRVLMMNQFLGADGNLNAEGEATAQKAFGAQLPIMKRQWGAAAGTMIAFQLSKTNLGKTRSRALGYQQMAGNGMGGAVAGMLLGDASDPLGTAMGQNAAMSPDFLKDIGTLGDLAGTPTGADAKGLHRGDSWEQEAARYAQVVTRLSGLTNQTAETFARLDAAATKLNRTIVNFADSIRNDDRSWSIPYIGPYLSAFDFLRQQQGGTTPR